MDAVPRRQALLAVRLVFSFPVALLALLVVLMVLTVRNRFNDPDMWWHLKTGELIWNTHHIPTVDTFSYTTHNHAYVPHEWLSQLTIYAAYHFGGYSGMMLWLCVWGSLLLVSAYVLCALYSGNAKVAFLGALLIWFFGTVAFSIRPQLVGYLLLIGELLILHAGQTRRALWFLALPPLFMLWINCHGSFFLGLIIASLYLGFSFLEFRFGLLTCAKWSKDRSTFLGIAIALSIAALFVNPIGWRQVTYPINAILKQNLQMKIISEWQQLDVNEARGMALLPLAAAILLIPLLRQKTVYVQELLLVAIGAWFALHHGRMLIVFGILAAPIVCRLLADTWESYDLRRDRILPNAILAAICCAVIAVAFPNPGELQKQVETGNPAKAVAFLQRSHLSGNLLNEYLFGGYLIWAAPEHKVFVDGRGDVFEWTGVLNEYSRWASLQTDPLELLKKYHIRICLLSKNSPMARVLPFLPDWKTAYSDGISVVFTSIDNKH